MLRAATQGLSYHQNSSRATTLHVRNANFSGILYSMKSLSQTTPHALFLVGIPGAGKTFFAQKFSETFHAPFIEAEALRSALSPQPTYSSDEQRTVDALVDRFLAELVKTKRTFLCEANLETRSARQRVAKLARDAGYEPMFIWVQTEPITAEKRATKPVRSRTEANARAPITLERYRQLVSKFTPLNDTEKPIVISGKHTYASQAKIVLKRLARTQDPELPAKPLTVPERPASPQQKSSRIHIS